MLGFCVNGGQDTVCAHTSQDPEARYACAGAYFDHCTGIKYGRQEAQCRPGARTDRGYADFLGTSSGSGDDLIFSDI